MQLEVARKAFIRIRDVRHVELVNRTEQGRKAGVPDGILMAEIVAYQGRYQDAARLYTQAGEHARVCCCPVAWVGVALGRCMMRMWSHCLRQKHLTRHGLKCSLWC